MAAQKLTQQTKVKQHFVPEFYLKSYSGSKFISSYFKKEERLGKLNIPVKSQGYRKFFYRLSEEFVKEIKTQNPSINGIEPFDATIRKHFYSDFKLEDFNNQFLEDYFSKLESKMAVSFKNLLNNLNGNNNLLESNLQEMLSPSDKAQIAQFFALQSIRVPAYEETTTRFNASMAHILPKQLATPFKPIPGIKNNEKILIQLSSGSLKRLEEHLTKNYEWRLAVIDKGKSNVNNIKQVISEFLLSDNPIINHKYVPKAIFSRQKYTIEFGLPLSSRFLLLIKERTNIWAPKNADVIFTPSDQEIKLYNDYQTFNSEDTIFYTKDENKEKIDNLFSTTGKKEAFRKGWVEIKVK